MNSNILRKWKMPKKLSSDSKLNEIKKLTRKKDHFSLQAKRAKPTLIGSYVANDVRSIVVSGSTAYIGTAGSGWLMLNVATPTTPLLLGSYNTGGLGYSSLAVSGSTLYAAGASNGLQIFNVATPASPSLLGTYTAPHAALGVVISGTTAFVAYGTSGLHVVNVATPASPILIGSYPTTGNFVALAVSGSTVYLANNNIDHGLYIINVATPASPALLGAYLGCYANSVTVSGSTAYVAAGGDGLLIIDVATPASPVLLGSYPASDSFISGVAITGSYAYVSSYSGLYVINVATPASPVLLGSYAPLQSFKTVVSNGMVYAADGTNGLEIFDKIVPNEEPVLVKNQLTIQEDQTQILTSADLAATDIDSTLGTLIFQVSNVTNGYFDLTTAPAVAVTRFAQDKITAGQVRFQHSGIEAPPSYKITVDDGYGAAPVPAATATITYIPVNNKTPVLTQNQLAISNGQTKLLTMSDLAASDADWGSDQTMLQFIISNVQHGQFYSRALKTPTADFFQHNITSNHIQFIHDGSNLEPSYKVSASDGLLTSASVTATIDFNASPSVTNNHLTVTQGQRVIVASRNISAIDDHTATGDLVFSISDVQHGQFELSSNPDVPVTTFPQQEIIDKRIRFVHDNSELAPSYALAVSDSTGSLVFAPQTASITYTNSDEAPTEGNNNDTVRNSIIGGTTSGVVGLGFLGLKLCLTRAATQSLYKTLEGKETDIEKEQLAFRREVIQPIANMVFEQVGTTGLMGYRSEESTKKYVAAIENIIDKIAKLGVNLDMKSMTPVERNGLFKEVAKQTKKHTLQNGGCCTSKKACSFFSAAVSPEEIENKAADIAKAVRVVLGAKEAKTVIMESKALPLIIS